jgi:transcriptional regulator with XRE-family HTH domain
VVQAVAGLSPVAPRSRELQEKNWIAAHIRERRYELELTQQEVAERAGTSHSFISKLERGDHIPTIPVLERILGVLDEQLLGARYSSVR